MPKPPPAAQGLDVELGQPSIVLEIGLVDRDKAGRLRHHALPPASEALLVLAKLGQAVLGEQIVQRLAEQRLRRRIGRVRV